jgi:OmcA/MtrC family decaheme c-type cytochrome
VDPKVEIADIIVTSVAGVGDTVTFNVFAEDGTTPVLGQAFADYRFYIADIVPAGTLTTNTPVATWSTSEVERWLYESSATSTPTGTFTEIGGGAYSYTFAADIALGGAAAPEFNIAHIQRLMIRAGVTDPDDLIGLSREAAIVEFTIPADGGNTGVLSQDEATFSRAIVVQAACTNCHGDPLQSAAHGSSYQTPQGCVICHTPIGTQYGDLMQADEAWLASLIHGIHSARGDFPAFVADPTDAGWDFSEVTYPKFIKECSTCHFDAGQAQADSWKTNPTAEACATCHDVTFGAGATHTGGTQLNSACVTCHPADGNGFGQSVSGAHAIAYDAETQAYNVTISLSPDANADGVYEVGETILVTATSDLAGGFPYTSTDTAFLRSANLYVYGPRALAVPVLTPGSTTDPSYMDPLVTPPGTPPDQGRVMLASAAATDANVLTDADGFKYQLMEITADMAAGTYMVQTNIDYSVTGDRTTDGRHIGPRLYPLDGWQLETFQVGTATDEPKVAGECTGCHDQRNFSTFAHRSYFGTDGCLACHDQSGNHADPLTNRVHAVHAASVTGDLANRDWSEITFPRNLNASCAACHNSGNNSHRENPNGSWGFACLGCHADTVGARDHMVQMGAPFPVE